MENPLPSPNCSPAEKRTKKKSITYSKTMRPYPIKSFVVFIISIYDEDMFDD